MLYEGGKDARPDRDLIGLQPTWLQDDKYTSPCTYSDANTRFRVFGPETRVRVFEPEYTDINVMINTRKSGY